MTQDERNCDHKTGKTSKWENHFSLSGPLADLVVPTGKKSARSLQIMYSPLTKLVSSKVENRKFLRAQFDFAFRKRKTDHERKCKRARYAGMSHELNQLLPFETLTMKITIKAHATNDIKNRSRKET